MNNKKATEFQILSSFIQIYKIDLQILSSEEAKSIYKDYNDENPDFIVRNKTDIFGIELVELLPSQQNFVLFDSEQKKLNIRNNAHLNKKLPSYSLLNEVPDLAPVALEVINKKIEKCKEYIINDVWLLAHTTFPDSIFMLQPTFEDNEIDNVVQYLLKNIANLNIFKKIFLFENGSPSYVIEICCEEKKWSSYKYKT
jgi:hypothetical protein